MPGPDPSSGPPSRVAGLPILERRAEITEALTRHQVVILCGETGSGKTTQLPQICLDMGLADARRGGGVIGHTQPRRLAARAVAVRIAEERNERVGGLVGAKIRFQDETSRATRIKVMTDGILLAELAGDPELRAYSTIIIDEAHERSLNIDFLLGYLRTLLPRRPDLKLIITSATIEPRRFSEFFGGPAKAPVIEVSGRMFPVEVRYRPHKDDDDEPERVEVEAVADAVDELISHRAGEGDVLVFLPGEKEIRLAADALRNRRTDAEVLPLFSRLTNQEQDRIFHPSAGRRRVILSTNVAETSLTVPGIRYVVDTGLARLNRYDPARKIQRLLIEPISQASANQRAGRCGRVAAGICIRLYTETSYRSRPVFTDPEIRRVNLAGAILRMKSLGLAAIEEFPLLDPPDVAAIKDGYETLFELGAIDSASRDGRLTPVGERMSRIPLDPRISRMLLGAADEGCLDEIIILAAALSIQDPRQRPLGRQDDSDRAQAVFRDESSDFLTLLKIWDQQRHARDTLSHGEFFNWCHDHFLAPARLREWGEMVAQLGEVVDELGLKPTGKPATPDAIHRALLVGLISYVACREGDGSFDYRGVRGNVVQIFPGSALFKKGPKWIMAAEVAQTTRLYARTVARVDPDWIEQRAGHMFRRQITDPHLDADTGKPSAWERLTMSGIVVVPRRRADLANTDPKAARAIFIREALASCKWNTDAGFMQHNRAIREQARSAEAKLRKRNLLKPDDEISAWFDKRLPPEVRGPETLERWRAAAEKTNTDLLKLTLADVLKPDAAAALDPAAFPDTVIIGEGATAITCPVEYALSPGKDEDGITLTIGLRSLPLLTPDRAAWLVPGLLPDLVAALIRLLPKPQRAAVESKGDPATIAAECAEAMSFASGSFQASLSEAIEVLHGLKIDPALWQFKGLPAHLRLRIRVVSDESDAKELGSDRDLPALQRRFASRIQHARASDERVAIERTGITAWDFGNLPGSPAADTSALVPALLDAGASVTLTALPSAREAHAQTALGLRRLFAIPCQEEVVHYLHAHPSWPDMTRHFAAFGSPRDLELQLSALIADRVFLEAQPPVRTKAAFEERQAANWGRLSTASREVCDVMARVLDARAHVAKRFSGGTPRLWSASVADIREHAAYLMPQGGSGKGGFLSLLRWERLKRYPVYAEAMRDRLLALREEGSRVETESLATMAPHWKKFTGWVAAQMSAERNEPGASATGADARAHPSSKTKAPLPQARRAAPKVNLDAGEWAMHPGRLPPSIEKYRWALEELRVTLFAPDRAPKPPVTAADLDRLWREAATV